ncbi:MULTISPECIES: hypothetical protein [unclassified Anaeromyxobacter]|uniref:hypothetical protein n=1 Tax=unclassified Anaeromyxobacter TaxID=2620896 RepID=UPI001F59F7CD|nr:MULTISPECIES: hypothetical protein [unclassified Anaeromyxobacter]
MTTLTETGGRVLPRLHWGAVIAGALVALAAHVVLGLVGAAIGFAAEPADSQALGAGAAIWAMLTPFVATAIGAWIAVRMAADFDAAGSSLHGVVVWAIGLIAGALFLAGTLASGAMSAGTAASGNAGAMRQMMGGRQAVDPNSPRTQIGAERASDAAGKAAAAAAGGAAMAAIAGLLGAFAGASMARRRREGRGLGWSTHRTEGAPRSRAVSPEERAAMPGYEPRPSVPGEVPRGEEPFHH